MAVKDENGYNGQAPGSLAAAHEGAPVAGRPEYWRSLNEWTGQKEFDELVHREFPSEAGELLDPVSRRNFIKVMGASVVMAGMAGCARQPEEKIVPYVKPPEELVPGRPNYYATAMPLSGYGYGALATSYDGRPTKIEGLREHPSSLGATNSYMQASVLDLYNPGRLDTVTHTGNISTFNRFVTDMATALTALGSAGGAGLRILSGTVTSPTLGWQMARLQAKYPNAVWHQFEPVNRDSERAGARMAFGEDADTLYDFRQARVILSLDANFLSEGPGQVRNALDFSDGRDFETSGAMSRLYMVESSPTITGAMADHKLNARYGDVETLARLVAQRLGVAGAEPAAEASLDYIDAAWVDALVSDLETAGANAVAVAGVRQPAVVHALAHAINERLGSQVMHHIEPVEAAPLEQMTSLRELVDAMNAGQVRMLVILSGNPVYDTPGDIDFAAAMDKVALRAHLADHLNETSHYCHWVLPEAHYLESWGDVRGHDGTVSLIQPLIAPLYGGRTASEVVEVLLGADAPRAYDLVRSAWRASIGEDGFDTFWQRALGTGIVEGTAAAEKTVRYIGRLPRQVYQAKTGNVEMIFRPDPSVYDGRFADNPWLQELPRPLTNLTWDNAVHIHPETAGRLQLTQEDVVEIEYDGSSVRAPVQIQFGHPRDVVTIFLGYGRQRAGLVGKDRGFDAYRLQRSASPWFVPEVTLRKTNERYLLARTEEHHDIEQSLRRQGEVAEERHLIREATLADFSAHPDMIHHMGHEPAVDFSLYPEPGPGGAGWEGHAWGMTIDLNRCIGCNACVVACQAENNIPAVGKDGVHRGREMHWIRVDRYYKGDFDGEPEAVFQPVPCMQCENAPCEPVCPVAATQHSHEGLNDMVYNRCIGTRYCSNNCPYKVRRFNFFNYMKRGGAPDAPSLRMMRNPNVTVRGRGVMEKCTYCVQRINLARIDAKRDSRRIADGEVVTACQSACPTRAIQFGDINDPTSVVSKMKQSPRNYGLLADINTRPRTTYLAKLRNPNPAITPGHVQHEAAEH